MSILWQSADPTSETSAETGAHVAVDRNVRNEAAGYVLSVVAVAGILMLRVVLGPRLGDGFPIFFALLSAVIFAAWYGGTGPALVALSLAVLSVSVLIFEPQNSLVINPAAHVAELGIFLLVGLGSISMFASLRNMERRSAKRVRTLEHEIDARKRTEVELADRERSLQASLAINEQVIRTLNGLSDGFWQLDRDWRYVYVNDAACLKVNQKPSELIGQVVWDAFPAMIGTIVESEMRRTAADRKIREFEYFFEPMNAWFANRVFPTHDLGIAVLTRDITQHKQREDALRKSEQLLRLASAAGALVYEVDLTGKRKILSYGLERIVGYAPSEVPLTNEWWLSLIHPDDLAQHRLSLAKHIEAGAAYRVQYRIRHKDGRWIWCAATAQVFKDDHGNPLRIVGTLLDVTERKTFEDALRRSEQDFRRLHALSARCLIASDLTSALQDVVDRAIETCNAAFGLIQLFNSRRQSLEIAVQRGFERPFLEHFREVYIDDGSASSQTLQTGRSVIIEDVQLDSMYQPHREIAAIAGYRAVASTPLKTHDGRVLGALLTHFRTPHRPSESEEQQLDLYARCAADLIARIQYEEALREADERKDHFVATLAHELRNPLAPMRHCLELLKRPNCNPSHASKALATMERQTGLMVRLIEDLLDVSRIASDKVSLELQRSDLRMIVEDVLENNRTAVAEADHELIVTMPEDAVFVTADIARLTQVFSNLLTNACKYTERGGRICVTVAAIGGEATVSFKDTGVGIPAHLLPKIFERFMQMDHTLDKAKGGLGLGLPLVKRLVELHGGRVAAYSEGDGRGSEFIVRLPIAPESSELAGASMRVEARSTEPPRILIVDDNEDNADMLAKLLEFEGYDSRTAYNGKMALAQAERFRPHIVLLDIELPDMTGNDVCHRLREASWTKGLAIVALTGWSDRVRDARDDAFDDYLLKPLEPSALIDRLKAVHGASAR